MFDPMPDFPGERVSQGPRESPLGSPQGEYRMDMCIEKWGVEPCMHPQKRRHVCLCIGRKEAGDGRTTNKKCVDRKLTQTHC